MMIIFRFWLCSQLQFIILDIFTYIYCNRCKKTQFKGFDVDSKNYYIGFNVIEELTKLNEKKRKMKLKETYRCG